MVRIGPNTVLLESEPSTCRSCGEENYIPKVIPEYREATRELKEVERDGALPQELGDLREALPHLHRDRIAMRGEKRKPRRAP